MSDTKKPADAMLKKVFKQFSLIRFFCLTFPWLWPRSLKFPWQL